MVLYRRRLLCPNAPTNRKSGAGSVVTASCAAIAREVARLYSSAACSRAGGGSPFDPPGRTRSRRGAGVAIHKQGRLRHRKDFDAVFRRGRAWNNDLLVLRTLPNDLSHNRYGFVTSKRVGKAVVRNRVRRRLSEALRVQSVKPGWDVVISAKTRTAGADFHELKRAVVDLLARANLLEDRTAEGESSR